MLTLTMNFFIFFTLLQTGIIFQSASAKPTFVSRDGIVKTQYLEVKDITHFTSLIEDSESHAISRRAVDNYGSDPNENPYLTGDVEEPVGVVNDTDTAGLIDLPRSVISGRTEFPPKKWPGNTFNYYIDTTGFSAKELNYINDALTTLEVNTKCIHFHRVDPKTIKGDVHYTRIFKEGENTCQANGLGYLRPDEAKGVTMQTIKLGKNCFPGAYGKATHEIMHALGFPHEQVRPDRDSYVTVQSEDSFKTKNDFYQFKKRTYSQYIMSDTFFKRNPYDFYSIMHYSLSDPTHFFLKSTVKSTMTMTLNKIFQSKVNTTFVGQRSGLTCGDINKLDFVYGDCKSKPKSELMSSSKLKVKCAVIKSG